MSVVRKKFDDGISTGESLEVEITGGRTLSAEEQAATRELFHPSASDGFEFGVRKAEEYWTAQPAATGRPEPLSAPWYRKEILREISAVRKIVALKTLPNSEPLNKADLEHWIVRAIELGALLTDADWRFSHGPNIRTGRKVRAKNKKASERGVKARAARKRDRAHALAARVSEYRLKHPNARRREIAANLVKRDERGDARAIHKLEQQIARMERRK